MELPEKELPLSYDKQYGNNLRVGCISLYFSPNFQYILSLGGGVVVFLSFLLFFPMI